MTVSAEFIGGPWDGVRRELAEAPEQLTAAIPPVLWLSGRAPLGTSLVVYRRVAPRRGSPPADVRYVLERVAR